MTRRKVATPNYINDQAKAHLEAGQPVISVDCKKKENVGDYANVGAEWEPEGEPTRVGVHDFPDPEMGKAIPCCPTHRIRMRATGRSG